MFMGSRGNVICPVGFVFDFWIMFYHTESVQRQSHYCCCMLWCFGTWPFSAYMPRCFYKTIKKAVLIRYLEEQKS